LRDLLALSQHDIAWFQRKTEGKLENLPVEFRETIVLRDIHGLDYREIADVVAAPIGTVMSRLTHA